MYHYTECVAFRQGKNASTDRFKFAVLRDMAGNIPYISLTMSGFALFRKKEDISPPSRKNPAGSPGGRLLNNYNS